MATSEEPGSAELKKLLSTVQKTSDWLIGYCCSYSGPRFGEQLKEELADYEKASGGPWESIP